MNLTKFAEKYRLKVKRSAQDGAEIIIGNLGQIYEHSLDELAVVFIPEGEPRTRLWRTLRGKCLACGMTLRQDGDAEGAFTFNPEDNDQAKLAIKVASIKQKKRISDRQRSGLVRGSIKAKNSPATTVLQQPRNALNAADRGRHPSGATNALKTAETVECWLTASDTSRTRPADRRRPESEHA